MDAPAATAPHPPRRRCTRLCRALASVVLVGAFAVVGLRLAIHWFPAVGPFVADGLRSVVGTEAVTALEKLVAGVEDRAKRVFRSRDEVRSMEDVGPPELTRTPEGPPPEAVGPTASSPTPTEATPTPGAEAPAPLRPTSISPMYFADKAKTDGEWTPVLDPLRPAETPLLFTTMVHPDPKRPWAEVFVVLADLARLRLYAVAGTIEPKATLENARHAPRPGLIKAEHRESLLAAFNGGFKTEHGGHGMHVDGMTLVPAREGLCTIAAFDDGSLRIGTWQALADDVRRAEQHGSLVFYRQAAACFYEGGKLHPRLIDDDTRTWGATLEGNVVIRRSAIGLDASRSRLYVGVSNDTTARAMARAMNHVGASDVLQLDVNYSYPRFVLFPRGSDGKRHAEGLFKGFLFDEDDYVERPSPRDFFYLVRAHERPSAAKLNSP